MQFRVWRQWERHRESPVNGNGVAGSVMKDPAFLRAAACEVFATILKVYVCFV